MIDLRLEPITKLKEGTIEKFAEMRKQFIALDNELVKLGDNQDGHRNLAIARTHLEQCSMNAIKVIAIQGEDKSK